MRKMYMIVAPNPVNHGEDLMAVRQLDLEQYSLIEGIFDELNVGNRYFRIAEIPIRVIDRVTVTGRGNILICSNADCLEIDQRVKADFLNTVFEVSSIEYITPHTTDIGVILRPNDQVLEIPLGSTLEVLP